MSFHNHREDFKANDLEVEVFLPVVGFADYEVSNFGRVRSHKSGSPVVLTETRGTSGYLQVGFWTGGRQHTRKIHRLVLEAFVGAAPSGHEGCHGDGDRGNNRLDNLRWDSPKSNTADRRRHGTHIPSPLLTEAVVRDILTGAAAGEKVLDQADRLGVHPQRVTDVRSGKTYKSFAPDLPRGFKNRR